jgi:hypothetical protein
MSYTLRVAYGVHSTPKDAQFLAPHLSWADVFAPEITYVDEDLEDKWNEVSLGRAADFLSCVSHPFFAKLVRMTARKEKVVWLCDYFDDEKLSGEFTVFTNRFASLGTLITKRYDAEDCAKHVRTICSMYAQWQDLREQSFVDQLVTRLERLPATHHVRVLVFFGLGHRSTLSEKLLSRGLTHEVVVDSQKARRICNRGKQKYTGLFADLGEYARKLRSDVELVRMTLIAATYHLGYNSKTSFRLRRRIANLSDVDVLVAYEEIRRQHIATGFQKHFRLRA